MVRNVLCRELYLIWNWPLSGEYTYTYIWNCTGFWVWKLNRKWWYVHMWFFSVTVRLGQGRLSQWKERGVHLVPCPGKRFVKRHTLVESAGTNVCTLHMYYLLVFAGPTSWCYPSLSSRTLPKNRSTSKLIYYCTYTLVQGFSQSVNTITMYYTVVTCE